MEVTNRQSAPVNPEATIRVSEPMMAQSAAADITIRPDKKIPSGDDDHSGDFVLKGRVYTGLKCLSDNSGEAQVFLVEGDEGMRVLKVYYPNFTIKKDLLRIIQNFNMEMIVKITDFGKTYVDGKNRDYELMEYLRGGTLSEYDLNGNYNQFRRIALQAAAALAYCHHNNIIHKDIKPGNYFFELQLRHGIDRALRLVVLVENRHTDTHQEMVLADSSRVSVSYFPSEIL